MPLPAYAGESSTAITSTEAASLAAPANPIWKDKSTATASWDAVGGANYYKVNVYVEADGAQVGTTETGTSATELDLQHEINTVIGEREYEEYSVYFDVAAQIVSDGSTVESVASAKSDALTVSLAGKTKLATPMNVALSDDLALSWDGYDARATFINVYAKFECGGTTKTVYAGLYRPSEVAADGGSARVDVTSLLANAYGNAGYAGETVTVSLGLAQDAGIGTDAGYRDSDHSEYSNSIYYNPSGSTVINQITLSPSSPLIAVGKSMYVGKTIDPDSAYYSLVNWSGSDDSVFTVDSNGQITGVAKGNATLIAQINNASADATVSVYELSSNVSGSDDQTTVTDAAADTVEQITKGEDTPKADIANAGLAKTELEEAAKRGDEFSVDMSKDDKSKEDLGADWGKAQSAAGGKEFGGAYDVTLDFKHKDQSGAEHHIGNITELDKDITFELEMPKGLPEVEAGHVREYSVVRVHDGEAESIPFEMTEDGNFRVTSSKFSDYVIAYSDTEQETSIIASGTCGGNITWSLSNDGTLLLEGTGAMNDYSMVLENAPWWNYRYSIETIKVSEGITSIGIDAFSYTNVKTASLPDTLEIIDGGAFYACSRLSAVHFPDALTRIGSGCFYGDDSLQTITIPKNVTTIVSSAFSNCDNLMAIFVDEGNSQYADIDGVLFNSEKTTLYTCPAGKEGAYNIPEGVISIEPSAFRYCTKIDAVTLPSSLENIGSCSFSFCTNLTELIIPENVQEIRGDFLEGSTSLTRIDVSENNEAYCDIEGVLYNKAMTELIAFPGSMNSYSVPEGTISISYYAFGYSQITDLTLPSSLVEIGPYAFSGCRNLANMTIPSGVSEIDNYAFRYCSGLKTVTFDGSDPAIYSNAFEYVSTDLTLIGHQGGQVESFCNSAGITFESIGHTWNTEYTTTVAPTCLAAGEKSIVCSDCGLVKSGTTESVSALGHDYAVVVTEPTCEAAGFTTHTCTRCSDSYTDSETNPLGHSWGEGVITASPSFDSDGVLTYICSVCGDEKTEIIPAYVAPTGLTATYGQTLADVALPTGFAWQDAVSTSVGGVGSHEFKATYTPSDADRYGVVKDVSVTVTVEPKKVDNPSARKGLAYNGKEQTGVAAGEGYTVMNGCATEPGTYIAKLTLTDKQNTVWDSTGSSEDITIEWSISKPDFTWCVDDGPHELSISLNAESSVTWSLSNRGVVSLSNPSMSHSIYGNHHEYYAGVTVTPLNEGYTELYAYVNGSLVSKTSIRVTPSKRIDLSSAVVSGINSFYTYTGSAIVPLTTVTLNGVKLTEGVDYTVSESNNVNVGKATVNITGIGNYRGSITGTFQIEKANPAYSTPTGLTATYGQTLADVALPEGFSWQDDPTTTVGAIGTHSFKATYTPNDTANYNVVRDIDVAVAVSAVKISAPAAATGLVYSGEPQTGVVADAQGLYTVEGGVQTDAGDYIATAKLADPVHYVWEDGTTADKQVSWSIAKATPAYAAPTGLTATYRQTLGNVALPEGFSWQDAASTSVGAVGEHAFKTTYTPADTANYDVVSDIDVTITVSPATVASPATWIWTVYTGFWQTLPSIIIPEGYSLYGDLDATNAGDYVAVAELNDPTNFTWDDGTTDDKCVYWSIKKAAPTYEAPTGLTATYGQTLADVALPYGFAWQDDVSTTVGEPGEHTFLATYTPADTANYNVVRDIPVTVTVSQPVYRMYNPITSEHLFTTDYDEYSRLTAHDWKQEGVSWTSPVAGKGVYRVYNPGLGAMAKMSHHYTSDYAEAANLVAQHGWQWDNGGQPIFYSAEDASGNALAGASEVYRLYNDGLSAHHFTLDASENSSLISDHGWNGEGVGFYAFPAAGSSVK